MTLLPIVDRELRVASRRRMTYWGRAVVAGVGILVAAYVLIIGEIMRQVGGGSPAGEMIFWVVGGLSLFFAGAAGVIYTADVVSKERRDGTLGLLFLTDLRGWDVALGKLASSSLGAFYGLIAIQPIMAISLLMGGVTGGQYARMCFVLVITAASSLSIGLFSSTYGRSAQTPPLLAATFAVFATGFFPLTGSLLQLIAQSMGWVSVGVQRYSEALFLLTPIRGFLECADVSFRSQAYRYWVPTLYTAAIGLMALIVATWRLPRIWQDTSNASSVASKSAPTGRLAACDSLRQILDQNPIIWLVIRQRIRRWVPLTLGIVYVVLGSAVFLKGWFFAANSTAIILVSSVASGGITFAGLLFRVWIANEAGRQLLADRRSGTIELQLVTPLTGHEFVNGHLGASWRTFRRPLILVTIGLSTSMATPLVDKAFGANQLNSFEMSAYSQALLGLLGIASFLASCWALTLTSLDGAMTLKNGRIALRALGLVLIVPYIAWMLCLPFLFYISMKGMAVASNPGWFIFFTTGGMTLISLVNSLFWGIKARKHLFDHFRTLAGISMESAPPKAVKTPPPLPVAAG